eukprot:gene12606-biopygen7763
MESAEHRGVPRSAAECRGVPRSAAACAECRGVCGARTPQSARSDLERNEVARSSRSRRSRRSAQRAQSMWITTESRRVRGALRFHRVLWSARSVLGRQGVSRSAMKCSGVPRLRGEPWDDTGCH